MTTLAYRPHADPDQLALGECTIRRTGKTDGPCWWQLWARVNREDNGQPTNVGAPLNPNGSYNPNGPGGKTWGLTKTAPGTWQVSPSINVLETGEPHPGEHPTERSIWHQTPSIIGVPDDEPWIGGGP